MSLFVVSDLHISGPDDPLYASLLSLLRERTQGGDTLVLAGDLFDLFVGRKKIFVERYSDFIREVRRAGARGVQIHYIEGNHDFLIRNVFNGVSNLSIHPKDVSIELGGKRFFVAHGDLVDPSDYAYRALRGFFRSPVMKALVAILPGEWVDYIGKTSSKKSSQAKPRLPAQLPPPRMENLRRTYRNFAAERLAQGYDFVVMGHCHDLDEMSFRIDGRMGQYVNVGYPRVHGSFLSWTPGDEKILRERLPL